MWGVIKIQIQYICYNVMRDADFQVSDEDQRKYFKYRSLTMFYCNIASNNHKITRQHKHSIQCLFFFK
jgi:hypothetical protein